MGPHEGRAPPRPPLAVLDLAQLLRSRRRRHLTLDLSWVRSEDNKEASGLSRSGKEDYFRRSRINLPFRLRQQAPHQSSVVMRPRYNSSPLSIVDQAAPAPFASRPFASFVAAVVFEGHIVSTRTRGRTLLSSFIKGTPLSYDQRVGSGVKPLLYI